MGKVVLLTGAPATGKSTLRGLLSKELPGIKAFDYGQLLLSAKGEQGVSVSYTELRSQSSTIVRSSDVAQLDEKIISDIHTARNEQDVLIDSHAVTREPFGFRAIPFSLNQLSRLQLDAVLVLSCEPSELLRRMSANLEGRREVTVAQAAQHQALQESVAMTYAVVCACPIYVIDVTSLGREETFNEARKILAAIGVGSISRRSDGTG